MNSFSKGLVILRSFIWFLSRMIFLMKPKMWTPAKISLKSLTNTDYLMVRQASKYSEGFATLIVFVRFLSSMNLWSTLRYELWLRTFKTVLTFLPFLSHMNFLLLTEALAHSSCALFLPTVNLPWIWSFKLEWRPSHIHHTNMVSPLYLCPDV